MIPLQLNIEGLYSYQKHQTIDFTTLTKSRIFGIFGSVGSGKSTIVEAITFALYGEIERLNSKEKRAYNMMNLKSKRMFIEFDFQNHENRIFRATREFVRNRKNFEEIKKTDAIFYEKKGDSWQPIDHCNAEKLLGLSYENFKRTIIIPQGQFKEFLELRAKDRTEMMKEIFQLHKYDLYDKTSQLMNENQKKLDQLEGQLKGHEQITEEILAQKKKEFCDETEKFEEQKKDFKGKEKIFNDWEKLQQNFVALEEVKDEFQEFQQRKEMFAQREKKLLRFEKTEKIFSPLLKDQNRIQTEFSSIQKEIDKTQEQKEKLKTKFNQLNDSFKNYEKDYNKLPQLKCESEDWKNLIFAKQLHDEIESKNSRIKKGERLIANKEQAEEEIRTKLNSNKSLLNETKSKKRDTAWLLKIDRWFLKNNTLKKDLEVQQGIYQELSQELEILVNQRKDFPEQWQEYFDDKDQSINETLKKKEEKLGQLLVMQKLEEYARHLHDGDACPLCGALEHPNLVSEKNVTKEISELENELQNLNSDLENNRKKNSDVEKLEEKIDEKNKQISEQNKKIEEIQSNLDQHQKTFVWKDFSPENEDAFIKIKEQSLAAEKEIQNLEKDDEDLKKDLENLESETSKYRERLKKIQDEVLELNGKKNQELSKIDTIAEPISFLEKPLEELSKHKENLDIKISTIENNYLQTETKINQLKPELASVSAIFKSLSGEKEKKEKEKNQNDEAIKKALHTENFSSIENVLGILKTALDTEKERQEIQQFQYDFAVGESKVLQLEKKLEGKEFNPEKFLEQKEKFETEKKNFDIVIGNLATLKSDLQRIEKQLEAKKELLQEFSQLDNRSKNLKIIQNLFKGSGFVQYVSSIFLRQLCDHANVRFHRMTHNQLSLQINENHDFEIIDYLNEGRSRSVKTLSGGQSFQASLSLALALAESVQSQSRSSKNFFFIDEGFGSQDQEAVDIVFETLMNLQKENRIVGIISHVEELKEKIPIALNVIRNEEEGSLVELI